MTHTYGFTDNYWDRWRTEREEHEEMDIEIAQEEQEKKDLEYYQGEIDRLEQQLEDIKKASRDLAESVVQERKEQAMRMATVETALQNMILRLFMFASNEGKPQEPKP